MQDNIQFIKYDSTYAAAIPVIYITKQGINRFFKDYAAFQQLLIGVSIGHKQRTAQNIVAYINNQARNTIVLGAFYHYWANADTANTPIRATATTNAGGTATLVELGRLLQTAEAKNNNYLLIHFSGNDSGVFGSKYWLQQTPIAKTAINYMINVDLRGQYDTLQKLAIGGIGSSPAWPSLLAATPTLLPVHLDSTITTAEHTFFYRAGIPVLFFYTNKPQHYSPNTANTLSIENHKALVHYIYQLVLSSNPKGKLAYSTTSETSKYLALP